MARNVNTPECPATLRDDIFYGLTLDEGQRALRDAIWSKEKLVVLSDSCAGSGKTSIAVATANLLVQWGRYQRIYYIMSPCAESRMGYRPGTQQEKERVYYTPLFQALDFIKVRARDAVEDDDPVRQKTGAAYVTAATDSFLRGVNFHNAVVLIDEAQNFTVRQLRTVISRCADDCKVVVIGSSLQVDLPDERESGLRRCIEHFERQEWCTVCPLTENHRGKISAWTDKLV